MNRDFILERLVPYSLAAVSTMAIALTYAADWDTPKRMEIYFDGKLSVEGSSNAFVSMAVESGLMHCRSLLEFFGLCVKSGKLANIRSRRPDDVGIESFSNLAGPLKLVTPAVTISHYSGPASEAEEALLSIFHVATKGLAHFTTGFNPSSVGHDALEIASRIVPSLVISHLYTPLGLPAPDFQIKGRSRRGR